MSDSVRKTPVVNYTSRPAHISNKTTKQKFNRKFRKTIHNELSVLQKRDISDLEQLDIELTQNIHEVSDSHELTKSNRWLSKQELQQDNSYKMLTK